MKHVDDIFSRPQMLVPEEEAGTILQAYEQARVILEYGSGGSTVMAAEMEGKQIFSVESDKDWMLMMRAWFEKSPPAKGTEVDVIWADIGPTKQWGYPKSVAKYRKFAGYPLDVWDQEHFQQPDVVLIDGRFRAGCALAVALRTKAPVRVFIDDYKRRKRYHAVEKYIGSPRLIGRMAEFEVHPIPFPVERLKEIIHMMTHP